MSSRFLLVYIDTLNRKTRKVEKAELPSGYIEQPEDEPIEVTARVARDSFEVRSDQALRLRTISEKEFAKILEQESQVQEGNTRQFETIFEKSKATPGKWISIKESAEHQEPEDPKKKREKRLFK